MIRKDIFSSIPILLAVLVSLPVSAPAAETTKPQSNTLTTKKVSFPATPEAAGGAPRLRSDSAEIVFSAPPRENLEASLELYQPIVNYLSKAIGQKVVYKYPGTWGVYRTEMLKGGYDIIFDGPHFNSYRTERLQHHVIAKVPGEFVFVAVTKKDNAQINGVRQITGRTVCAHAPPNLGTLALLNQFDNPARQPVIISTDGWQNIYNGVISGRCSAGVLPLANLKKYDAGGATTKVIFKERALPNQAFSTGPRLSPEDRAKLARALTSPEAAGPTEKLRKAYAVGERFIPANNQEYAGISDFLRNEWGYY